MPKRSLAIVEVTPERELEPPPSKRQRVNPFSTGAQPSTASSTGRPSTEAAFPGTGGNGAFSETKAKDEDASCDAPEKNDEITRIISWNVETPVPFLDLRDAKSSALLASYFKAPPENPSLKHSFLRSFLKEWKWPDFVCLQEVRARPTDADWKDAMRAAANGVSRMQRDGEKGMRKDGGPTYTAYWALNASSRGQRRFGVCTLVSHSWVSRIRQERTVDWDAEGRVHILEMDGWPLINVYALNGSDYPWNDPRLERDPLAAALPQKTRNERKREFNMLLLREVQDMQARGLRPVLIGDFNISLTRLDCYPRLRTEAPHSLARKQFNEAFIPQAGVVDVFRHVHGGEKGYSWFAKGKPVGRDCARVDYALVDRRLVEGESGQEGRVAGTGYGGKSEGKSDHGVVWLNLRSMRDLKPAKSTVKEVE
ncbi:DNase I-like protein [Calocera cornea HHB12733]|uniref:DNase I-like protein n=1 Tax=Calocera cornea HHB12733 TaxID=1353952 RepID=A0A165FQW8_9BASI|nr:DNase I-like protein [Calocera cornea HHB12733]